MKRSTPLRHVDNEKGVSLVFVAICIVMLIGMAALSIDIFHLVVARNELQNAADSGALAGARVLYNNQGTAINTGCNALAVTAATDNKSEKIAVEVAPEDVLRGHWRFSDRMFIANDSTAVIDFWNYSREELDANTAFINAVQVTAHRQATPVESWFARIFGFQGFVKSATAVAYIGFAGSLAPGQGDQPIAICRQSIVQIGADGKEEYLCKVGRMLNSGSDPAKEGKNLDYNTSAWTNMTQPCETANASDMKSLVCGGGNPDPIFFGKGIGTTNGVQGSTLKEMQKCWAKTNAPLKMTLPVIDCPGNKIGNCMKMVGAVQIEVVWINDTDAVKYENAPRTMENWPGSASFLNQPVSALEFAFVPNGKSDKYPAVSDYPAGTTIGQILNGDLDKGKDAAKYAENNGRVRWASFVHHFDLRNVGGPPAPYAYFDKLSVYFRSSCTFHEPTGTSQGENYGILARIPVLVN